jgi:hypothetical protein
LKRAGRASHQNGLAVVVNTVIFVHDPEAQLQDRFCGCKTSLAPAGVGTQVFHAV